MKKKYLIPTIKYPRTIGTQMIMGSTNPEEPGSGSGSKGTDGTEGGPDAKNRFYDGADDLWN